MINTLNGTHFRNLIDSGIRNLARHTERINQLNVFPVPDGDTGTNMVKTLRNGFSSLEGTSERLSELSARFSKAVVFGARGNSGVIVSQFFKGFSEHLRSLEEADCRQLTDALRRGVEKAYASVARPVEGTVLTVLRESTEFVEQEVAQGRLKTVDDVISGFVKRARESLENTPNLLPVLKSAGVVDSGGAGVVCLFEGMEKYLNNESIEVEEDVPEESAEFVDYSRFGPSSLFEFGYCTELLLQLTEGSEPFDAEAFSEEIRRLGDSVALSVEEDKVKIHVHVKQPEQVLAFCHRYGEFLTVKIENMSVQHSEAEAVAEPEIFEGEKNESFSVVAVAGDKTLRELFLSMGADVVIAKKDNAQPSTNDFINAYLRTGASHVFVFPNSKNANLAALQAAKLYDRGTVTVFDTKSGPECYAALSMMDFESSDPEGVAEEIRGILSNVYAVAVSRTDRDSTFNGIAIKKGDFVAFTGTELLAVGKQRVKTAEKIVDAAFSAKERDTVTVFLGKTATQEEADALTEYVRLRSPYTEVDCIPTENEKFELLLSFE